METISVDKKALKAVLAALTGPQHLIMELKMTMALPNNPISLLVDQYNASNDMMISHKKEDGE